MKVDDVAHESSIGVKRLRLSDDQTNNLSAEGNKLISAEQRTPGGALQPTTGNGIAPAPPAAPGAAPIANDALSASERGGAAGVSTSDGNSKVVAGKRRSSVTDPDLQILEVTNNGDPLNMEMLIHLKVCFLLDWLARIIPLRDAAVKVFVVAAAIAASAVVGNSLSLSTRMSLAINSSYNGNAACWASRRSSINPLLSVMVHSLLVRLYSHPLDMWCISGHVLFKGVSRGKLSTKT